MERMFSVLDTVLTIVITFGLAVFVHEFGHMIFALIRGVGVESFAIGMGPRIISWKWRGIDFSLRWFPVGGFVKLQGRTPPQETQTAPAEGRGPSASAVPAASEGQKPEEAKDEKSLGESSYDDLYALQDKGFLTKVMVFGGGVFMNYVTAVLCWALVLWIGFKVELFKTRIEKVPPASALAKSGLKPGDTIVAVNGKPVKFTADLDKVLAAQLDEAGERATLKVELTVERGGGNQALALAPMNQKELGEFLGALEESLWRPAYVRDIAPNSTAERAGIKRGDTVLAVNGKPVSSYSEMAALINQNIEKTTTLRLRRSEEAGSREHDVTVTPRRGIAGIEDPKRGYVGIVLGSGEATKDRVANPFKALMLAQVNSVAKIKEIMRANVQFFKNATFKQVRENVAGPIGIAAITAKVAKRGWEDKVNWFILLNLLLMIFNLLPLPVLDGGFILLAVVESVIRRPVPPKVLGPVYTFFVVGLILLMVLISVQDVINIIPKP